MQRKRVTFPKYFASSNAAAKKVNKRFQKRTKFSQKEFNMHTLNHPLARHSRSSKIDIVHLYKLPNENK
jgi:hypothetical protein